ncbi:MAG: class I SAM-dependent RNA methyltransferase [Clostridia bacterium]|jgi:putative N6-adenine-specific DNA methylase|nr:class I SAM-dependent RNA methyltransferase [Clostridia bacterium]
MEKFKIVATTTFGLEGIVKRELEKLGYENLKADVNKVSFIGTAKDISICNLWLRSAERVFVEIASFECTTFENLFEEISNIKWENYISEKGKFPVNAKSINSTLFSLSDIQSISKKAIVKRLSEVYNTKWLDESEETYKILVEIMKDRVSIMLDSSGAGLHKRGYRIKTSAAPIRETLAAAIVNLSMWKPDRTLIDPFCGSGTILIEAALAARNIAPGLSRSFDFEHWKFIDSKLFREAKKEAFKQMDYDKELKLIGTDIDPEVLKIARENAENAGVDDCIHFQQMNVSEIKSNDKYGYIVTNPPYGERLEDKSSVIKLYNKMRKSFDTLDTWSFSIVTSFENFEKTYGKKANKNRKVYNGKLKCYLYNFYGPKPPKRVH